jgi:hypothetical protein
LNLAAKRRLRALSIVLTALLLLFAAWALWRWWVLALPDYRALDVGHYLDATRRWTQIGTPYLAYEVQGPYEQYSPLTFLHPPVSLLLFWPFIHVPLVIWWLIPAFGVIGAILWWRPHWAIWPVLALATCTDGFRNAVVTGNTDMWMAMGVAGGLTLAWPAVVALIKPTFVPIALLALRSRQGILALMLVAVACLPFGALWFDWLAVVRNGPGGLAYSLPNYLWVAAPALAWLAQTRTRKRFPRSIDIHRLSQDPG